MKNGSYFAVIGYCDSTGWYCRSYALSWVTTDLQELLLKMQSYKSTYEITGDVHERKMKSIRKQLHGELPFGLE